MEKEGFELDRQIDLMSISDKDVLEIMKSIPNTGAFLEKVGDMLMAKRPDQEHNAIFIRADMDHLKHINDTYGFETGDRVISLLYILLDTAMRTVFGDYAIARAHGDEFILFAFGGREDAEEAARHVIMANQKLDLEALSLPCRCNSSLGIALLCDPVKDWRRAYEYTFEAVSAAKRKGGNSYEILRYPV
jgi:diguanylate cyclase (GGDEF)-like protein